MKLLVKSIFILLFFVSTLFANVVLKSSNNFVMDENFIFEIEAEGSDIEFPDIKKIDNQVVINLGTSRTISNINGNILSKIKKTYSFKPKHEFILPSFEVKIDGNTYKTEEKTIKELIPQKSNSSNFDFGISVNKDSLYVGEESLLTLRFKYKKDLQINDLAFAMPIFNNIWSKKIEGQNSYEENGFIVQELKFLIFPQKSGILKIPSIKIEAKIVDLSNFSYSLFAPPTKTEKIYSNSLNLDVKPLPNGVSLVGDFLLKTSVSKTSINEGDSLSYKVEISGNGNIDDIDDIKLNIKNATIYEDKPKIETKIENNKNIGSYTKSFSIIANENFEIPAIEFKYFDIKMQKVVTQKSQSYKIKVNKLKAKESFKGLEKSNTKNVEKVIEEKIVYKSSLKQKVLFFILGIIFTLLIFGLYFYVKNRKLKEKDDLPLISLIKRTKNKNDLIKILLPYIGYNKRLDEIIFSLEKEKNLDLKIIKKEIVDIIKSLNL